MADVGTMRRIDAGILDLKHIFMSVLVLLVLSVTDLYFNDINVLSIY